MSETSVEVQEQEPHEERKASPIAGCLIFTVLLVVFTTLGVFIVYTYMANKEAMEQISEEVQVAVTVAQPSEEAVSSLKARLEAFSEKVADKQKCEILISAEDLNTGIARFEKMSEFKEKMYITNISSEGIEADICFPVKAGLAGGSRYINGSMTMQPEIAQGSIFPVLSEIRPSAGGEVIERVKKFLPQALFSAYRNDPDLVKVFHKLSEVELHEGYMLVKSDPTFKTADKHESVSGSENFFTGLAIAGILFFVFFSTVVLIYLFTKKSRGLRAAKIENDLSELEEVQEDHEEAPKKED